MRKCKCFSSSVSLRLNITNVYFAFYIFRCSFYLTSSKRIIDNFTEISFLKTCPSYWQAAWLWVLYKSCVPYKKVGCGAKADNFFSLRWALSSQLKGEAQERLFQAVGNVGPSEVIFVTMPNVTKRSMPMLNLCLKMKYEHEADDNFTAQYRSVYRMIMNTLYSDWQSKLTCILN